MRLPGRGANPAGGWATGHSRRSVAPARERNHDRDDDTHTANVNADAPRIRARVNWAAAVRQAGDAVRDAAQHAATAMRDEAARLTAVAHDNAWGYGMQRTVTRTIRTMREYARTCDQTVADPLRAPEVVRAAAVAVVLLGADRAHALLRVTIATNPHDLAAAPRALAYRVVGAALREAVSGPPPRSVVSAAARAATRCATDAHWDADERLGRRVARIALERCDDLRVAVAAARDLAAALGAMASAVRSPHHDPVRAGDATQTAALRELAPALLAAVELPA